MINDQKFEDMVKDTKQGAQGASGGG